jgi:hypothetical protein
MIALQNLNVIRIVVTEEEAQALETKGFTRLLAAGKASTEPMDPKEAVVEETAAPKKAAAKKE